MKLTYKGTGTVHVPGAGDVSSGGTIEVADDLGKKLIAQSPKIWSLPKDKERPAPRGSR